MAQRVRTRTPNLHDFLAILAREEVKPVYAIMGEEELLKAEAVAAIKHKALGDADPSMCYVEYDGEEVECSAVFDELRTLPFFGSRRVALLEKADKFIERFKDALNNYVDSPPATGILILLLGKLDARTKLGKALTKWKSAVECQRLYDRQVPGWIVERARRCGKRIAPRAAQLIAEYVGSNLGQLSSQIDKLVTYVGDREQIGVDDVAELTDADRTRTVFELTDCIGRKDVQRALVILNQFTRSGDEAPYIVSMLAWQLRRLWKTKRIVAQSARASGDALVNQVHQGVGGGRFFIQDLIRQSHAFTEADLLERYRLLLECDIQAKTSGDDPKTILEVLMLNLCR